jgi:glycine dehydrogenase subunit 2
MNNQDQALIFEMSREGRIGYSLPELDVPETEHADSVPDTQGLSHIRR